MFHVKQRNYSCRAGGTAPPTTLDVMPGKFGETSLVPSDDHRSASDLIGGGNAARPTYCDSFLCFT